VPFGQWRSCKQTEDLIFECTRADLHRTSQRIDRRIVNQFQGLLEVRIVIYVDLCEGFLPVSFIKLEYDNIITVTTGPKISSVIVTDRGSCVKMTVG
jgi:hypothetical protein